MSAEATHPAGRPDASSRIAVVGAGVLGVRTARELLTEVGGGAVPAGSVTLHSRRRERVDWLTASFGEQVVVAHSGDEVDVDASVVVLAREVGAQAGLARRYLAEGRHVVCTSDGADEVEALLALDTEARTHGVRLVAGAAMSPGLSCLLAGHAAALLDRVDEIHVARHGAAGPACARQRLRALRGGALERRDGEWVRRPGFSGRELAWFPDPIGGRDCYRADLAEPRLLSAAFPAAHRVTARIAASRRDRALAPFPVLLPPPEEGGLGAVRVEVRGERTGERATVVYGALDRPAVAGAAVAALAAHLVVGHGEPGARGLAGDPATLAVFAELARRGVRVAAFEGDGPADAPT